MDVAKIARLEIQFLDGRVPEHQKAILKKDTQRVVGQVEVDQLRQVIHSTTVGLTDTSLVQVDLIAFE